MADFTRADVAEAMFLAASNICSSKFKLSSADWREEGGEEGGGRGGGGGREGGRVDMKSHTSPEMFH